MSRYLPRGSSKLGPMEPMREPAPGEYDVVIVGGAVAGASTAIVLKRGNPKLRILVVEKTERFDWKVGESTVEVSSYFLTRVLKQWSHLVRDQLPKQAFRYWFFNDDVTCLREASETGPTQLARTPSFQLDRAKLDEHLLKTAREEGTELWRPAKVTALDARGSDRRRAPTRSRSRRATARPRRSPAAGSSTRPAARRCSRASAAASRRSSRTPSRRSGPATTTSRTWTASRSRAPTRPIPGTAP